MTEAGTTYITYTKAFGKNYSQRSLRLPEVVSGDSRQFRIMAYLYSTIPLRKMTFLVKGCCQAKGNKDMSAVSQQRRMYSIYLLAIRRKKKLKAKGFSFEIDSLQRFHSSHCTI